MKRILAIVLAMLMLSGMAFAEEPQFDGEIIIGASKPASPLARMKSSGSCPLG